MRVLDLKYPKYLIFQAFAASLGKTHRRGQEKMVLVVRWLGRLGGRGKCVGRAGRDRMLVKHGCEWFTSVGMVVKREVK
jgi:hypothetical protein